jgi:thymidylate synthase (FAD)
MKFDIHNDGFVSVERVFGDELAIVNAARVSYNKHKEAIDEADIGLLKYLLREQHGTPFEHAGMSFHVRCPIFVAREWFRHRIGSFSEMSGRYVEMTRSAYVPNANKIRRQVGKTGHYTFESVSDGDALAAIEIINASYDAAFDGYNKLLEQGIAKEVARNVLPLGLYTEFHWTVNLRSLMNFIHLRNHPAALEEIRDYAEIIERLMGEAFPNLYPAWVEMGKKVP